MKLVKKKGDRTKIKDQCGDVQLEVQSSRGHWAEGQTFHSQCGKIPGLCIILMRFLVSFIQA